MGIISNAQQTPDPTATSAADPTANSGVATTTTPTVDPSTATPSAAPTTTQTQTPTASTTAANGASSAASYTPATASTVNNWNVTPDQTVAGQTTKLIADDSPIIQQARTAALQQQNANGTLNSSMAITAGQAAAYQAALPIAQADAATQAKAAGYNADQANQMETFNATQANNAAASNTAAANTLNLSDLQRATQVQIDQMDNANKLQAQQMQNDNSQILQSNAAAATLFQTAMSALNNITQNSTMDSAGKTAASAQVWGNLQAQLDTLRTTSSLNLSDIITGNPYSDGSYQVPTNYSGNDAIMHAQMDQAQQMAAAQAAAAANAPPAPPPMPDHP